jgi:hypothetical protein
LAANSPEDHQGRATTWEDAMSRVEHNQGGGRDPARRAARRNKPGTLVPSPRRVRFADPRVTWVLGMPIDPLNLSAGAPGWQG